MFKKNKSTFTVEDFSDTMLFYGLYDIDSASMQPFHPNLEFCMWPRHTAFVRLPTKNGKRYRSFMIEDILDEKQERNNQVVTYSSSSMERVFQQRSEFLVLASPDVPVFHYNVPPVAPTCTSNAGNPGSKNHQENIENVPKYFRTILKESRQNRRNRTVFSRLQMQKMEELFERKKYLSTQDRNDFAKSLCLTSLQVKTWYQNRRMKWKKEMLSIDPTAVTTRAKGRPRKGEF